MSTETTTKKHKVRIMQKKKRVSTPTRSNNSIFPLLKDVVHTPDI